MREKLYQLKKEVDKYKSESSTIEKRANEAEKRKTAAKKNRVDIEIKLQKMRKEVGFLEVNTDGKSKMGSKLTKAGITNLVLMYV